MDKINFPNINNFEYHFSKLSFYQALTIASYIYSQLKYNPEFTRKLAICHLMIGSIPKSLEILDTCIKSSLKSNKFNSSDIESLRCFWGKIKYVEYLGYRDNEKYIKISQLVLKPTSKKDKLLFLSLYYHLNNLGDLLEPSLSQLFDSDMNGFIKKMSFNYDNNVYYFTSAPDQSDLNLKLFLIAKIYQNKNKNSKAIEVLNSVKNALITRSEFKEDVEKSIKANLEKVYSVHID